VKRRQLTFAVCVCALILSSGRAPLTLARQTVSEPLPSWNPGPAREAIVGFVQRVTKDGGPDFVPPAERIATFDNDGTLWSEQPIYFQVAFALDRVKTLAPAPPRLEGKAAVQGRARGRHEGGCGNR
jgi:hypothetical protein